MENLKNLQPERVFKYFEEISKIPRGSGNMERISSYCLEFAKNHSLTAYRDKANNVIIKKEGTKGYETASPVILQGHLDMVCQKEESVNIDFNKDGLKIYKDKDFIKAEGTTLGADNGIAVAMILAILESNAYCHPPIEAVFTTDEEIGMIGTSQLSFDKLKGKRMINIDSEDPQILTVSCAGGSDFEAKLPLVRERATGKRLTITVKGLKGGHSGVEINSGRVNSNILMARILNFIGSICEFNLISVNGGDKANAIPNLTKAELITDEFANLEEKLNDYIKVVKKELIERESGICINIEINEENTFEVLSDNDKDKLIYLLMSSPNGVMEMSAEIEGLVETSLNLGILKTQDDAIIYHFALRSNKKSALDFLEEKLKTIFSRECCEIKVWGHYPPWEFRGDSELQKIYKRKFKEKMGQEPLVKAIHAGLECGVFASSIEGLDCISIGPCMKDIHTTSERLSISSTSDIFEILLDVLQDLK